MTLDANSKTHLQCSPRPGRPDGGGRPRPESGRVLRFVLVVFLLVGYGVASAHSHTHGETGVSTCTICLAVETEASVSGHSLSSVVMNPEVAFAEPTEPNGPEGRDQVAAVRARSPPS